MSTYDTYWRDRTCKCCVFQIEGECRRNPPTLDEGIRISTYPSVNLPKGAYSPYEEVWSPACSQYKPGR